MSMVVSVLEPERKEFIYGEKVIAVLNVAVIHGEDCHAIARTQIKITYEDARYLIGKLKHYMGEDDEKEVQ